MKRAFNTVKGKLSGSKKKKGKRGKNAEGNQVESNQSETDRVNRSEVVKSVDNVEANERKLEDTPVISSDNTLDNVAATPAASIHQTTHSEETGTVPNATSTDEVALTPAESINQAMHPEGVRMNAGRNMYYNVQGNQTQTINNDNRHIINSNNNVFVRNVNESSKIQKWIGAPNPSINFNAAYDKMTKGTGVWLLEDSRFNEWKDEGGLLWLQGKAGSGKTFLCTKAIFSISAEHQVVYFYFDTLDQTKSKGTYQGMLSSLMLDKPSTTCIFIDAMDECQASDQHLVSRLIRDLLELGSKIRMFVSCRHTASTVGISSATYEISLNEQVVESDIQRHIEQVFQDRPLSVDVHKEVTEALAHGAHGQIRWVDCQIQQMQELATRTAILTALKNLPDDLEETYCQALVRVNKHHQKDVEAILKWLLFGYEELKLELLPEILRVNIKQQTLEDTQTIRKSGLSKIISSTLVIVQEGQTWRARREYVLQLAHPSVKEYILSETILQSSAQLFHVNDQLAHKFIAQLCMIYLVVCGKDGSIDEEKFPLAEYAAERWPNHVRNLQLLENPVKSLSLHLLTDTNKSCFAWMYSQNYETSGHALPLYYAAMANLPNVILILVEEGANVSAQGGEWGNALQTASYWGRSEVAASYWGREEIVKLLVEKGADINAQGGQYGNALQATSYLGREEIVKLLVEKGADINAQGGQYGNAPQAASYWGREEIVKLLVEKGADINAQGGQYGNALQAASHWGRQEIMKLLVEKGADINAQGGQYGNALQAAAYRGSEEMLKLLVEKGADINAQGGQYGNALQAASYEGREEIVKLLVEKGADINAQGGQYGNALYAASYLGKEEIVKLLVEKGAYINAQGGQYGNALYAASYLGREEIVKLLVEKGADINAQGGQYGNALQAASYEGREEIVKLLVEKGADINAQGGQYGNALQAASYGESEEIVKLLVEKGADINAQGGQYGNALQAASCRGREEIVKLLVEKEADINAQGGKYGNALQAASYIGFFGKYIGRVKLFLDKGADINAQGGYFGNALQAASYGGETDIVKFLVEKGANVNIEGGKYGTALQAACVAKEKDDYDHGFDYLKQVEILLNNGADINSRGGRYGSPIQAAAFQGNQEIFDLLMQRGAAAIDPIFTVFQEDPKIPFPLMDNEPADHHIYCPIFWNM
ncbi:hypothetical protein D9758_018060 [Tetrapyrgos nigripes]|uniref:Nephrocystin 3-like N-terminal domain-containing protein n=1 Tax=Tetrapyrgos nigripes TaxID=182062 RepID=A0A8H5BIL1_9AGAR|nr:hypothetical protein D9758_018060 [Tetrapyrgos nigripes]